MCIGSLPRGGPQTLDWPVMLNLLGAVYNSVRFCGGAPVRRFILGMIPEPVSFYTQTFFEESCMFSIRPFLLVILSFTCLAAAQDMKEGRPANPKKLPARPPDLPTYPGNPGL